MSLSASLAGRACLGACLASVLLLSACGGGGSDTPQQARANSVNTLTLESGRSGVPANSYLLDVAHEDASGNTLISHELVEFVWSESPAADLGVIYARSRPEKFLVMLVTPEEEQYACVSAAWSMDERQFLQKRLRATSPPSCSKDIDIDVPSHRIQVDSLTVLSLGEKPDAMTFSANVQWVHRTQRFDATVITVVGASGSVSPGDHEITSFRSNSGQSLGNLTIGTGTVSTDALDVTVLYPQQDRPDQFAIAIKVHADGSTYACATAGLSSAEREAINSLIGMVPLPDCPASARYNFDTETLTLDNARFTNEDGAAWVDLSITTYLEWLRQPTTRSDTPTSASNGVRGAPSSPF